MCVCIYQPYQHEHDVTQGQFFNWILTDLNSEFSFT